MFCYLDILYAIWDHPEPQGGRPLPFEIAKKCCHLWQKVALLSKVQCKIFDGKANFVLWGPQVAES